MERIKAFYPVNTEKIVHVGKSGNEYYLDAIDIPLRIYQMLVNHPNVQVVEVDSSDDSILYNTHSPVLLKSYKSGLPKKLSESSGLRWNKNFNSYVVNTAHCATESFREAMRSGRSFAITSGGHHAEYETGKGFGPINNMIIAARELVFKKELDKVAILDLDVHFANGTHSLVVEDNIISTDLWKFRLAKWKYTQNNKNIYHLKVSNSKDYFSKLEKMFSRIKNFGPELLVVMNGLDVLNSDRMGGVSGFGENELVARSKMVGEFARKYHYPVTVFTGGGYIDYAMSKVEVENAKNNLTDLYIKSIFSIMNL